MKNEMNLDGYGVVEKYENENIDFNGGDFGDWLDKLGGKIFEKIFKITDNGTLLDGEKGNTDIDCYIFNRQIF